MYQYEGILKEQEMIYALNNKKISELSNNLRNLLRTLYGVLDDNEIVTCEKVDDAFKTDFVITYKGVNSNDLPGVVFDYKNYVDISIKMAGTFQPLNAACAIESAVALRNLGWKISDKAIMNGLHNAHLPGRFEVIAADPVFVIDGAHNEPASKQLAKSIATYFPDKRLIFIIGVLKDKEYDKVVRNTCELAWQVITVTSPNRTRALPAYELAKTVYEVNPNVTAADSIPEAVETALMMASRDDVIVSFGSLSYLGEVRAALANRR